jgi:hypothetical protein
MDTFSSDHVRRVAIGIAILLAPGVGEWPTLRPQAASAAVLAQARTPPWLAFIDGEVSFWRPGTQDWAPASVNMPLAPGDALYTGPAANLELQIGSRAFMRAGEHTQLGFENQEPGFLQFKVTLGHISLDLRSLTQGQTIEIDTPNAAFTIDRTGYYRADVTDDTTTFITRRGGRANMTSTRGETTSVAASEEAVVEGTDVLRVETYVAPELDDWDRWNYDRTDQLIDAMSARYVSPGIYGAAALDHYGIWRIVPPYGPVWMPDGAATDWVPYSTGSWVWDPYYGWTWVDRAPWGWAPYHYGRWVFVDGYWAWAPGPVVAAPAYAPALVAFFGGGNFGARAGFTGGIGWCSLGWGEPLIPWWGPVGFVGVPWWGGWGGPHVVNNVVINRKAIVNTKRINWYQNAGARHGVVVIPRDRFGHGPIERPGRMHLDPHRPVPIIRGAPPVRPVAASLVPVTGTVAQPPAAVLKRPVVATRGPRDVAGALTRKGLKTAPVLTGPPPRLVTAPRRPHAPLASPRPPFGLESSAPERPRPPLPPRFERGPRVDTPVNAPREAPAVAPPSARQPAQPPPHPVQPAPQPAQPAPQPAQPAVAPPERARPARPLPAAPRPHSDVSGYPPRPLPGQAANRVFPGRLEPPQPRGESPASTQHGPPGSRQLAPHGRGQPGGAHRTF